MGTLGLRVAFFEVEHWEKHYIGHELPSASIYFSGETLSPANISFVKDCQVISVFIGSQITKEILDSLPNLKMIATRSTGFDHIDLKECKKRKITVCNVPHYGENTVAEHTFALILDLSRKLYDSIDRVKKDGFAIKGLTGFDLKGKTLGIVGMGHIGQHVARIANGFEMKVLGYDKFKIPGLAKKFNFEYVSVKDLLKHSDIISLHLPYNKQTHHTLNSSNMNLIKKGAYLINTARGGLVETNALIKALMDGTLAGAGLDVIEDEPEMKDESKTIAQESIKKYDIQTMLQNHMLMEQHNVIVTPHNAFNSQEALERILQTSIENIQCFVNKKVINKV